MGARVEAGSFPGTCDEERTDAEEAERVTEAAGVSGICADAPFAPAR